MTVHYKEKKKTIIIVAKAGDIEVILKGEKDKDDLCLTVFKETGLFINILHCQGSKKSLSKKSST